MFISSTYHINLPNKPLVEPRPRYKKYYRDLHQRYNIDLDEATFVEGGQYKFNELSYPLFDLLKNDGYLHEIDLLVCAYWSHEFDPDYASSVTHLSHLYDFNCDMFDVLDQGTLCTLTSVKLIKAYFDNDQIKLACCYALDQTTNPRSHRDWFSVPNQNVSSGVVFSKHADKDNNYELIDVVQWTEQFLLNSNYDVTKHITQELASREILLSDCILYVKRNTTFYKAYAIYKSSHTESLDIRYFPLNVACSDALLFMHNLVNATLQQDKKYYLYVEEDVESLATAMLIIKHNRE